MIQSSTVGPDEHQAIAKLYGSETSSKMGKALFELISAQIPNELLFIAFLPIKFELPSLCSEPKYKVYCDAYIRDTNKYDIWLRRSPVGPGVRTVRHSDHTPQRILKQSLFYREVMTPANLEYGASLVAWHGQQWLATLTVFRNAEQGDISDSEMKLLADWQLHFEAMVKKLALAQEEKFEEDSLANFVWWLPTSAFFMKWDLTPSDATSSGVELCNAWRLGLSSLAKKNPHPRITVPREIREAIPRLKPRIEAAKLSRPGPLRPIEFETISHPRIAGLSAKISFIPSKSLSISSGRFLVEFHYDRTAVPKLQATSVLSRLSRSERNVAVEAAKGLSNAEIGKVLRKSPGTVKVQLAHAFKKLKLKSRVQLARVLASVTN